MKIWRLFIHFDRGTRKQKEKKKLFSLLKCIQKSNVIKKNWVLVFMYLISVDPMDRSFETKHQHWSSIDSLFKKGVTNYSYMHLEYSHLREDPKYRASEISYEQDITIFNATKLKINIEGCVNTLSEECTDFYDTYGKFLLTLNFW